MSCVSKEDSFDDMSSSATGDNPPLATVVSKNELNVTKVLPNEQKPLIFTMIILFLITTALYCHKESNLSGKWILDDKATTHQNPVVRGEVPWIEVWSRDFWGHHQLDDPKSHKSWRPLCTVTLRLNYLLAGGGDNSYWFHVVDRVLHGLVTALALPVASLTFHNNNDHRRYWSAVLCAAFFGVHPIHVEAVANTTGRAEVLCALFYFLGFLVYTRYGAGLLLSSSREDSCPSVIKGFLAVITMLFFTWASMLCKEHGITLPLMCVIWDAYIATNTSMSELLHLVRRKRSDTSGSDEKSRFRICNLFFLRAVLSIMGAVGLAVWRLSKNGSSSPDFVCEQNPAACVPDRVVRFIHYSYLWFFNFWLMLYPAWLCPDWSGESIPLLDRPSTDPRFPLAVFVWVTITVFLYHGYVAAVSLPPSCENTSEPKYRVSVIEDSTSEDDDDTENSLDFHLQRRTAVTSFCWMIIPFLMSSNLFLYVGFVVADRTLYLPSFGFCLLLVQGLQYLCDNPICVYTGKHGEECQTRTIGQLRSNRVMIGISIAILVLYTMKQQTQTTLWSAPELIWGEAYRINPLSCINGKELGMSLVNAKRGKDAMKVLSSIHKRELASQWFTKTIADVRDEQEKRTPSVTYQKMTEWARCAGILQTRFKLITAMTNTGNCDQAKPLIEDGLTMAQTALDEIEKQLQNPNVEIESRLHSLQDVQNALINDKVYLLVGKSKCSNNLAEMGRLALEAVMLRPGMEYASQHAQSVSDLLNQVKGQKVDPMAVVITWTKSDDEQSADVSFAARIPTSAQTVI